MRNDFKALVVGCGSIGQKHIMNLRGLGTKNFILCDPRRLMLEKASYGLTSPALVTNIGEALDLKPDAAVVCSPSSTHVDIALALARSGVHLLIEMPLSHTAERVDELEALVRENGIVGMMAMCYRFHPVFTHIKNLLASEVLGKIHSVNYFGGHYLPDWHPNSDYRAEYAAKKSLGGGVVLTSIHGIDNIRWLFGEVAEVRAFVDKVSSLEMDVEDIAASVFKMKSGTYVCWQTDFLQRVNQHRMFIAGEKGSIRCDFLDGIVETFLVDLGKWLGGKLPIDLNSMYLEEMAYFLRCIENKQKPEMDINDGLKTLNLALEVKRCGAEALSAEQKCATA